MKFNENQLVGSKHGVRWFPLVLADEYRWGSSRRASVDCRIGTLGSAVAVYSSRFKYIFFANPQTASKAIAKTLTKSLDEAEAEAQPAHSGDEAGE